MLGLWLIQRYVSGQIISETQQTTFHNFADITLNTFLILAESTIKQIQIRIPKSFTLESGFLSRINVGFLGEGRCYPTYHMLSVFYVNQYILQSVQSYKHTYVV